MFDKIKKLMKKLLVLFGVLFFISCEDEAVVLESIVETDIPNPVEVIDLNPLAIQQIIFEAELNSTLEEDVVLEFDGKNTFSGLAPLEADINNLIPSFDIEDAEGVVYMDNEIVESGLTVKDFSKEVVVKTESAD